MSPDQNQSMQFGQGSQLLGGGVGAELQRALAQHRLGQAGVTAQSSVSNQPMPQPAQAMPPDQGQASGQPMPQPTQDPLALENQIIIKALSSKMSSNASIQKAQGIPPKVQPMAQSGGY